MILICLVVLLLAIALDRLWARHSLGTLSLEEKAHAFVALSQDNIWFPISLAVFAVVTDRLPLARLPAYYRPGVIASYVIMPFLFSIAAKVCSLRRLQRLGLPRSYVRTVFLRALAFYTALLSLICVLFYYGWSLAPRVAAETPTQTMELTASRRTAQFSDD